MPRPTLRNIKALENSLKVYNIMSRSYKLEVKFPENVNWRKYCCSKVANGGLVSKNIFTFQKAIVSWSYTKQKPFIKFQFLTN